jgi:uncharacterized damage-inducible protein DinB
MNAFFADLYAYHDEAQQRYIEALQTEGVPVKAPRLFSHVLDAQPIWTARLKQQAPRHDVWRVHTAAALTQNQAQTLAYPRATTSRTTFFTLLT